MDPGEDPEDTLRAHRSREKTFIFDTVFDQHASQVPRAPPLPASSHKVSPDPGPLLGGQVVPSMTCCRSLPAEQGGWHLGRPRGR